jgi:antitoxin VapB
MPSKRRKFELPSQDAVKHREGDRLIIEPVPARSLRTLLAALPPLDEDFAPIADPPPDGMSL